MVFEYILYGIGLSGLLAGSYTDLKTKEVPDWVSYSLIFGGLGLRLIFSLAEFQWSIFFEGLVGFLVFVALAYLMYYLGQWGGGDAKLLMGLGAVIGLGFDFNSFPKLGVFLVNLALVGVAYGMIWLVVLAFRNKKKFLVELKRQKGEVKSLSFVFLVILAAGVVGVFLLSGAWRGIVLVMGMIPIGFLYTWILVNSVEKVSFYKKIRPEELTEGDWIAKDVVVDGEKVCGPRDLGISEVKIAKLIELKKKGKVRKILIKEGIPFVPTFLLAFVLTIVFGGWWVGLIP